MWKERLLSPWIQRFFGLPPDYRKTLHEDIFALLYYGKGFIHNDVYNMPLYLRKFYTNMLVKEKDKEKKEIEKSQPRSNKVQDPRLRY